MLTDFGTKDGFAGIMKGVIATINPVANVIDITHDIPAQDVSHGAFVLFTAYAYFPAGTIFCCVVDPGVGSDRKGICIQTRNYLFVGPDNGICRPAADNDGIVDIYNLSNSEFLGKHISSTFHGRDVFAPVCAHLSKGIKDLSRLGRRLTSSVEYEFPKIISNENGMELTVLCADHFGNMVLNIQITEFEDYIQGRPFELTVKGHRISKICRTYNDARPDELFLVASSSGYMEISLKNGSAAGLIRPVRFESCVLSCPA